MTRYRVIADLLVTADSIDEALELAGFAVSVWDTEEHAPVRQCDTYGTVSVNPVRDQMWLGETA